MQRWKAVFFSPRFQYPVIATIILVAVSAWYYGFSGKRSETAVNERSLRALAAIANEFSSRLSNLEQIGSQKWDVEALREQVPALHLEDANSACDAGTSVAISDYKLFLTVRGRPSAPYGEPKSCWSIPFDRLTESWEEALPRGVFEDVLLADAAGHVLYQTPHSGMRIADLHTFFQDAEQSERKVADKAPPRTDRGEKTEGTAERENRTSKNKSKTSERRKEQTTGKQKDEAVKKSATTTTESIDKKGNEFASGLASSRVTDVYLGGERYKLYTVPIRVPALKDEAVSFNFVAGGLLHEDAFQAERARPLEINLITVGFFLLLGAVGIYPILRFRLMGPAEVLKRRSGFIYVLQMVLTAVLLGGLTGHLMFYRYEDETDQQLTRLANLIDKNLEEEIRDALDMLGKLENSYLKDHADVGQSTVEGKTCRDDVPFEQPKGDDWRPNILNGKPAIYPYFEYAYFADRAGYQEIKFSTRSSLTPEVRLCDTAGFREVLRERELWRFRNQPDRLRFRSQADPFWLEALYAMTTGRYLAFISRPSSAGFQKRAPVAAIGTELVSLSHPVFPPDYGFAIVDGTGNVLFHSTAAKNGRENFVDACDREPRLRDLIDAHESGTLETSYLGVRHRALVQPIKNFEPCPWSIVVFRDLTNWDEDHFDSVRLFSLLAGSYIVLIIIAGWLGGLANGPSWIWPSYDDRSIYWQGFCVLSLVFIFNFWLFLQCDGTQLWVTAYTIPVVTLAFTVLKLRSKNLFIPGVAVAVWLPMALWTWHHGASLSFWLAFTAICAAFAWLGFRPGRLSLRMADRISLAAVYSLGATVLLLAVGWIPALRLFNAAALFQQVVATRRAQLQLAEQLEERHVRISQAYLGNDGSEKPTRGNYRCPRLKEDKDLYYLDPGLVPSDKDRDRWSLRSHLRSHCCH